jgi:hypothetical protein
MPYSRENFHLWRWGTFEDLHTRKESGWAEPVHKGIKQNYQRRDLRMNFEALEGPTKFIDSLFAIAMHRVMEQNKPHIPIK